MVDHLTREERSRCMSLVHSSDTTPEIIARKIVFAMGFRYRLHRRDLPGRPDIVFVARHKVIFVHGCFWHMHKCKRLPKSRLRYWRPKMKENVERDKKNLLELKKLGWKTLVVWECELRHPERVATKIKRFLSR